jgi:5'-deoxynucleotidase YfbR-like HD superfamily hydrolase
MKNIKRCNNFPVVQVEDVAQHSFYVTLLAMNIADEYNMWASKNDRMQVDVESVMKKALLHDTEESFTSDIPWNIKHANDTIHNMMEEIIGIKIDEAYKRADNMFQKYKDIARSCKDDFSGKIVGLADSTELAIYCYEEYTLGNMWIEELLKKSIRIVRECLNSEPEFMEACHTLMNLVSVLEDYKNSHNVSFLLDIH